MARKQCWWPGTRVITARARHSLRHPELSAAGALEAAHWEGCRGAHGSGPGPEWPVLPQPPWAFTPARGPEASGLSAPPALDLGSQQLPEAGLAAVAEGLAELQDGHTPAGGSPPPPGSLPGIREITEDGGRSPPGSDSPTSAGAGVPREGHLPPPPPPPLPPCPASGPLCSWAWLAAWITVLHCSLSLLGSDLKELAPRRGGRTDQRRKDALCKQGLQKGVGDCSLHITVTFRRERNH